MAHAAAAEAVHAATTSPAITLPEIGAPFQGGFFTGVYAIGDKKFALITSGIAGELKGYWNKTGDKIDGAMSRVDGAQNTKDMLAAELRLAESLSKLNINGFNDWFLPSRDQLEMMYRAFKPTAATNWCYKDGNNPSSLPRGEEYTPTSPTKTSVPTFGEGEENAFAAALYWSSTQHEVDTDYAWIQHFDDGIQLNDRKSFAGRARAVRSFPI